MSLPRATFGLPPASDRLFIPVLLVAAEAGPARPDMLLATVAELLAGAAEEAAYGRNSGGRVRGGP